MNIPAHAGITLGVFYGVGYAANMVLTHREASRPAPGEHSGGRASGVAGLRWPLMDYRLVLVGALLPDLIDKPLAFWFAPGLVNDSTRSIGHSLIFNLGLVAMAFLMLYLFRAYRPLVLGLASAFHLALDAMWQTPRIFWWPYYGWQFPPGTTTLGEWFSFQLSPRWIDFTELLGFVVLLWFVFQLYRRRAWIQFLKRGTVG